MQRAILICLTIVVAVGLIYIARRGVPGASDSVINTPPAKSPVAPASEFPRTGPSPPDPPDATPPLPNAMAAATTPDVTMPDVQRLPRVDGKVYLHDPITLTREMHSERSSPMDDVSAVGTALRYYQLVYKENPVGSLNEEIIAQLIGNNPKGIVVIAPDHPDINGKGELVDRWGTPYFFHGLTRTAMDVWSAGPDRKFGTLDDVKLGIDEEFGEGLGLKIGD